MYNVVQDDISVDRMVDKFTTFITSRANIYFKKTTVLKTNTSFTCSNNSEKKKWYDQKCYSKKQKLKLQECIRNFNLSKTQENRKRFLTLGKITNIIVENANKILTVICVTR